MLKHVLVGAAGCVTVLGAGALLLREPFTMYSAPSAVEASARMWERELSNVENSDVLEAQWRAGTRFKALLPPEKWRALENKVSAAQWRRDAAPEGTLVWRTVPGAPFSVGFRLSPQLGNVFIIAHLEGKNSWVCPQEGCEVRAVASGQNFYFKAYPAVSAQKDDSGVATLGVEPAYRVGEMFSKASSVTWILPGKGEAAQFDVPTAGWDKLLRAPN